MSNETSSLWRAAISGWISSRSESVVRPGCSTLPEIGKHWLSGGSLDDFTSSPSDSGLASAIERPSNGHRDDNVDSVDEASRPFVHLEASLERVSHGILFAFAVAIEHGKSGCRNRWFNHANSCFDSPRNLFDQLKCKIVVHAEAEHANKRPSRFSRFALIEQRWFVSRFLISPGSWLSPFRW